MHFESMILRVELTEHKCDKKFQQDLRKELYDQFMPSQYQLIILIHQACVYSYEFASSI